MVASLLKPLPLTSAGSTLAALVASPSRSRSVLLSSNRVRRRIGAGPGAGPVHCGEAIDAPPVPGLLPAPPPCPAELLMPAPDLPSTRAVQPQLDTPISKS